MQQLTPKEPCLMLAWLILGVILGYLVCAVDVLR